MPFFRRVRGLRGSLPTNTILGRKSAGQGAAEIITPGDLHRAGAMQAPVSAPGPGAGLPAGGTNGQVLTISGGVAAWLNLPADDDTPAAGGAGGSGMLPLVNGDTPGPKAIADDVGQFIGVPL